MRAVVLAGGFGTRLRPLTYTRPKQMLPIVNMPLIERMICHLARFGVDEVVLSMGYRPDDIHAAYPGGHCPDGEGGKVALHYAVEPEPLDTAGAIRFAARDAGIDERFLVFNGDVLTDLDVGRFVAHHEAHGAEATIHLHAVDDPSRFGVVQTDDDGRVLAFVEKPAPGTAPSNLINAGSYVLEPSVLDRIPGGRKVSVERETFPQLVADASLYATTAGSSYWIDVGTPQHYLEAQLDLLDGIYGPALDGVDPTATIDPAATVSRSVLGPGAVVEAGAKVERSVLLPGARVAVGAVVRDSVLGEGASVGASSEVLGWSVVGDGESVEASSHLDGARVPIPAS
jgi:mannose-1-phosphate guanylyltransferase